MICLEFISKYSIQHKQLENLEKTVHDHLHLINYQTTTILQMLNENMTEGFEMLKYDNNIMNQKILDLEDMVRSLKEKQQIPS